jgi:hypothetical protein
MHIYVAVPYPVEDEGERQAVKEGTLDIDGILSDKLMDFMGGHISYYSDDSSRVISVAEARHGGCSDCVAYISKYGDWEEFDNRQFINELDRYSDDDIVIIADCES